MAKEHCIMNAYYSKNGKDKVNAVFIIIEGGKGDSDHHFLVPLNSHIAEQKTLFFELPNFSETGSH